jgi:UDP-N-acetylglucosamine acyltransferase
MEGPRLKYHSSNKIHPLAVIYNNVEMGKNNSIGPFAVIGNIGECRGENERKGTVLIRDNNLVNSGATIDSPVRSIRTKIGSNCFIMTKAHIGHDCLIGDNVTIAPGAVVGGVCIIDDYVNLAINCSIHQRQHIGESAMIGMGAIVNRHVLPFCTVVGAPARILGVNKHGAKRRGIPTAINPLMKLLNFPDAVLIKKNDAYQKKLDVFRQLHQSEPILYRFK